MLVVDTSLDRHQGCRAPVLAIAEVAYVQCSPAKTHSLSRAGSLYAPFPIGPACKSLVDRAYVRRGLYLGDGAWEELFDALSVPTLLLVPPDSPMAPRQEAFHKHLVRTVVVPGAGHCVRRDQPARHLRAVDAFLAEVVRA